MLFYLSLLNGFLGNTWLLLQVFGFYLVVAECGAGCATLLYCGVSAAVFTRCAFDCCLGPSLVGSVIAGSIREADEEVAEGAAALQASNAPLLGK